MRLARALKWAVAHPAEATQLAANRLFLRAAHGEQRPAFHDIDTHCGPWLGYLRYHIGLRVPASNPPSIRVKDQIHTWEEGRSVVFDDSWEHEVYNKSDGLRVVLIVDFLRPMPLPLHALNWTLVHTVGRHTEEGRHVRDQIEKYSWRF